MLTRGMKLRIPSQTEMNHITRHVITYRGLKRGLKLIHVGKRGTCSAFMYIIWMHNVGWMESFTVNHYPTEKWNIIKS